MLGVPEYQVEESGPDHEKSFRADGQGRRPGARLRRGAHQEGSRAAGRRGGLAAHHRGSGRGACLPTARTVLTARAPPGNARREGPRTEES